MSEIEPIDEDDEVEFDSTVFDSTVGEVDEHLAEPTLELKRPVG